jgi:sugar-phosphatase
MPGVIETLEFFRQRNIPMAVASSSAPELIKLVLEHFDIMKYFKFYHSAKFEKHGKPYPDVFLTAAKMFGLKPQYCLVFEDSYNGILAAKRAGMKVVAVPYPENLNNPDFKIADLIIPSLTHWSEEKWNYINQISNEKNNTTP